MSSTFFLENHKLVITYKHVLSTGHTILSNFLCHRESSILSNSRQTFETVTPKVIAVVVY